MAKMDFQYFVYSLATILNEMSPYILLGFLVAGLLHVFVPASAMSRHLSGRGWKPVVKAALFGIPLPLCSCGVLPAAVALRRQGASRGASTSFLIATPQTGVDSIAATYSLLGLPMAIIRPVAALVGAVAGGMAVSRFADKEDSAVEVEATAEHSHDGKSFISRLCTAVRYGLVDMVASVGKWLVIGLIVAALITVFVPESLFVSLSEYPLLAMLAVVVVAIPMYICATGSIPIAMSLIMKGLSPGIAFVMLMAGPAANFASLMILGRSHGRRATIIYVLSVTVTAIAFGLIIDMLLPRAWFEISAAPAAGCHHTFGVFESICSIFLVILLVLSPWLNRRFGHHHSHNINESDMKTVFKINGMACPHCSKRVEQTLAALAGAEKVIVDLAEGKAEVVGNIDAGAAVHAVELAGYECELKEDE